VLVIGAGNAGQAMAGYIAGYSRASVTVYDKSEVAVLPILEKGGIELIGPIASGFQVVTATTSLEEAVAGAQLILIAVPANEHGTVARDLAAFANRDQCVVLCPGYVGGTLILRRELGRMGVRRPPTLAETTTMPFASRLVGRAAVGIKGVKKILHVAALPSGSTNKAVALLTSVFSQRLIIGQNVLEVGLNNPNPITHVPLTVLNWGRIEGQEFETHFDYHSWISRGIQTVIDALDAERVRLMELLGLHPIGHEEFNTMSYDRSWQIVSAVEDLPPSAWTIPPRFLDEDVPCGLVPICSLSAQVGLPTPVAESLVGVASLLRGRDFRSEGRTVTSLGLEGMEKSDILKALEEASS